MKLTPTLLFLGTTILLILLGILTNDKNLDIQLHDTYFVFNYLHLSILFGFLTGVITLIYFGLEKFKRPIKIKTGFWHFGLFITGLLTLIISINIPTTSIRYYETDIPSVISNIYGSTAMILIGIILFLLSAIVFIYGLKKSLLSKRQ